MTIPFFNDSALKCSGPSSRLKVEDGSDDAEHELWSSWFIFDSADISVELSSSCDFVRRGFFESAWSLVLSGRGHQRDFESLFLFF